MEPAPNCAICNAPAFPECPCESEKLKIAVEQAEKRAMDSRMAHIRDWVVNHAREQILKQFQHLTTARRTAHKQYLASLPHYSIFMQYSGNPPLHPQALQQLQYQIREAHAQLKHGIDADWRASVQRYPEVLDFYYSKIELRLPNIAPGSLEPPTFATPPLMDGFAGSPALKKKKHRRSREFSSPAPGVYYDSPALMYGPPHAKAPPVAPYPPTAGGFGYPGYHR